MDAIQQIQTKRGAKLTMWKWVESLVIGFNIVIRLICAKPLLGSFDPSFQYIQEFTGFFTPSIVVIFILVMFLETNEFMVAILAAVWLSGPYLFGLKILVTPEVPFMDRVRNSPF